MEANKLLPIGSVVLVKDCEKRLMIYGIKQKNKEDNEVYDYVACGYPEGNISAEYNYVFNHESIEKIEFIGFINSELQEFRAVLNENVFQEDA